MANIISGKKVQDLFVVRIDTGVDKNNQQYMQLHVSSDESAKTSGFRLFVRPDDELIENYFDGFDIEEFFDENGAKKRNVLDEPIPIGKGRLIEVTFAPCKYKINDTDVTFMKSSERRVVLGADSSAEAYADAMITRVYSKAEGFYWNYRKSDDYRKYVVFDMSSDELKDLLTEDDDDE